MLDTLTVLAYLLGHNTRSTNQLQLSARFSGSASPELRWQGVPPDAGSLAVIVKSTQSTQQPRYYWVLYNLPIDAKGLPLNACCHMKHRYEGLNSWRQQDFKTIPSQKTPVIVQLYALDTRFSANHAMTGAQLEKAVRGHVLAKSTITW